MRSRIKKVGKSIAPGLYRRYQHLFDVLHTIQGDVSIIKQRVEVADDRLTKLRDVYAKADPYQPIYGITGIGTPQRGSQDRCEAIFSYFGNDVRGLRGLDIGTFFGYLTFYLAERGAVMEGWDNNNIIIEVAQAAQNITGIAADFKTKEFNKETVAALQPGQFDVVLILSVLHWTIALQGLEYVQDCMAKLFEKVPMVIVELAQKGEDKKLFWDKVVPENDLDIFAKVKGVKITKIGEFPTHLSNKKRPIYVVTKDNITVGQHHYQAVELKLRAYDNAPHWRPLAARYYMGERVFIKEYNYDGGVDETRRYLLNEINFLLQNGSQHNKQPIKGIPVLLDYEINPTRTRIVQERINGDLLPEVSPGLNKSQKNKIAIDLLEILDNFEKRGLYHNDIRSWNVMLDKQQQVYLIDMELVSTVSYENNAIAYLWLVHSLLTGTTEDTSRNKTALPPRTAFNDYPALKSVYDAVGKREESFSKLLALTKPKPASKAKKS